ncbi:hypothetical protein SAMN05216207_10157 [Pseudonocardia ammonioxydans]|uniref:Uncharacterized protein n=1 Tax=Pseudonocardia ammonioxydans TaxID=260086 RepID=A0A1I4ZCL5_PSUAM|nr:hypothetical protein [Pseudonocardia ammonioxydans]SFN48032.1 hypothetical protein SAMN05216207_10157 [Pseudonocardia ammonioxydans]
MSDADIGTTEEMFFPTRHPELFQDVVMSDFTPCAVCGRYAMVLNARLPLPVHVDGSVNYHCWETLAG